MQLTPLQPGVGLRVNAIATGAELYGTVVDHDGDVITVEVEQGTGLDNAGDPCGCSFTTTKGVAYFAAELVGRTGDEAKHLLLRMTTPPSVRERRQHLRVETCKEMRWYRLADDGSTGPELSGTVVDLSLGGARFETAEEAPFAGAMILVTFEMPEDVLVVIAQVVMANPLESDNRVSEVRVTFVAVEDGTGQKIADALSARAGA